MSTFKRNPTKQEMHEVNELHMDLELASAEQDLQLRKIRKKHEAPPNAFLLEDDENKIQWAIPDGSGGFKPLNRMKPPPREVWEKLLKLTDHADMLRARHRLLIAKLHKVCEVPSWSKLNGETGQWMRGDGTPLVVTVEAVAKKAEAGELVDPREQGS
jgi:hypothetical protein